MQRVWRKKSKIDIVACLKTRFIFPQCSRLLKIQVLAEKIQPSPDPSGRGGHQRFASPPLFDDLT